ncbi:ParB/RepB/Spo0J family partition protein [Polynucleobacter kasalickyi]|uniref:Chromosome segregation DNA-binding protein n=1 Tax=Polynucleobacter kasalickyi TaxID=1938817 RepID=A0A1W2BTG7_9BURK|nr:ParB/RepB/Spo0J family partition protein [Polynucleobacter kasalickyi]SMC75868.1 chromosome segregation DNA-binding protein [Polynucleobacter kasalickyi]
MIKKKGLGRGLEALLGESLDLGSSSVDSADQIKFINLSDLQRGKYQPRMQMKEGELQELSESIKQQGIMQPLLVRQIAEGKYEIIAGERRFRAAGLAGLESVPALIKKVDDQTAAAMALIENMQRQDLNPLEEADGLARLISDFGFTHEQAAKVVGKSRSAVTNLLRLTQLSKHVQALLMAGDIDMGHARAMLNVPAARQVGLAQRVAAQGLSVRETEKLANQIIQSSKKNPDEIAKVKIIKHDPDIQNLQTRMSDMIGLNVEIKTKSKGGEIKIKFSHPDELDSFLKKLDLS